LPEIGVAEPLVIYNRLAEWLRTLPPQAKIMVTIAADLVLLNLVVLVSYMLRISAFTLPPGDRYAAYFIAPVLSVICAYAVGIYQSAARNYSHTIERRLALSQFLAIALWSLWLVLAGTAGFARSVVFIYGLLALGAMIIIRRLAAAFFALTPSELRRLQTTPVIIYGAGREGMAIAEAVRRRGQLKPVAFLDTDQTLVGRTVQGLGVYTTDNLPDILERFSPREVILAKPGLARTHRRTLVDQLLQHGLPVKIAPDLDDIIGGQVSVGEIRPINVEDLLGRDPVPPDRALMERAVKDQVVMVTGAGGSIGSELVRQSAQFGPRKLVLVDHSEFALFEIHREMEAHVARHAAGSPELVPVLADIQGRATMAKVISEHGVDVVFHAAAYKHVRMVQDNALSGIRNNVLGTKACAEAALECGVKRFILISTDKAVRPTSVMGASKRLAEMVVQALSATKGNGTIFSIVRFGNVLGSTGSVVPLFSEQIANGGPVTVTHPDVTRYFMLISEAAQLVVQSSAMATGGDVFVLDMGEPIRVMQLAETMIELAGFSQKSGDNPDGDIDIIFTGLKEGEKLYEELEIGSDLTPTGNPRIMRAREFFLPMEELQSRANTLFSAAPAHDLKQLQRQLFALAALGSDNEEGQGATILPLRPAARSKPRES
jgi:FlaA1/EpsC-like NDP-sugar epimerase